MMGICHEFVLRLLKTGTDFFYIDFCVEDGRPSHSGKGSLTCRTARFQANFGNKSHITLGLRQKKDTQAEALAEDVR